MTDRGPDSSGVARLRRRAPGWPATSTRARPMPTSTGRRWRREVGCDRPRPSARAAVLIGSARDACRSGGAGPSGRVLRPRPGGLQGSSGYRPTSAPSTGCRRAVDISASGHTRMATESSGDDRRLASVLHARRPVRRAQRDLLQLLHGQARPRSRGRALSHRERHRGGGSPHRPRDGPRARPRRRATGVAEGDGRLLHAGLRTTATSWPWSATSSAASPPWSPSATGTSPSPPSSGRWRCSRTSRRRRVRADTDGDLPVGRPR